MVALHQLFDEGNHLGNMFRRARCNLRPLATERIKVFPERFNVLLGVVVDRFATLLRLRNDAVVDVGNVHCLGHAQALELQISAQHIRRNRRAKISDMSIIPNRWPAVIKLHFSVDERAKFNSFRTCKGIRTENVPKRSSKWAQAGNSSSRRNPKIQTFVSSSHRSGGVVILSDLFADSVKFNHYLLG